MGLGDLVLDTLKKVVDYVIELADDFGDVIKRGLRMFVSSLLKDDLSVIEQTYEDLFKECPHIKDLWEKEKENIKQGKTSAIQLLGLIASSAVGAGVGMGMGGFGRDIQNFFNKLRPVMPFDPALASYAKHTGRITDEKFKEDLLCNAWAEEKHQILYDYFKPKLSVTELLEAEKRIENLDYNVTDALKAHGYNDKEIEILRKLSWAYPSPTDFIRFAVRDVFVEDKQVKEALEAEFPEAIVPYAEKAGMTRDILMWYWKAHWELPSPTQVYEMLHRLNPDVLAIRGEAYKEMGLDVEKLKTDLETVKFYLKQADYDLRWRQRLIAISYNPLTRVDLRRIYQLGLISDEELVARLMEVGYTKADALKLLEFYKSLKVEKEKDLTMSQILKLFRIGEITEEECKKMLMSLGYDEAEAEFLIAIEKHKMEEEEIEDLIDVYVNQFAEGEIDEKTLTQKLDELGLRASRRDKIIQRAVRKRERQIRMPSKEDIIKWYNAGLITEQKARELLTKINIPEEFHDLYLGKKKE